MNDCNLEDFGARTERCKGPSSKDSPSKRKKLFGSLRSLRSLANLHSSPSKTKQTETKRAESPIKHSVSLPNQVPALTFLTPLGSIYDTTAHVTVARPAQPRAVTPRQANIRAQLASAFHVWFQLGGAALITCDNPGLSKADDPIQPLSFRNRSACRDDPRYAWSNTEGFRPRTREPCSLAEC